VLIATLSDYISSVTPLLYPTAPRLIKYAFTSALKHREGHWDRWKAIL